MRQSVWSFYKIANNSLVMSQIMTKTKIIFYYETLK